jgi:TIR domain
LERAEIFLSYARADAPLVDRIYEHLSTEGREVWLDRRRLSAGESWLSSIAAAIDRADRVIVVASQYSTRSAHVRWEHERAVASGKRVQVVRVDDGVPQLVGGSNETLHDFRIDPLDPARWQDLAVEPAPAGTVDWTTSVQPAYVRASARAAWPLLLWMAATAGVFSTASFFSDEVSEEEIANPALLSVYLPSALLVWALQWEVRRVHALRRRRLRANRNDVAPRVLRLALIAAGILVLAFYWWALLIPLLAAAVVSKLRKRQFTWFTRPRREANPPSPFELRRWYSESDFAAIVSRLTDPVIAWSRSSLRNYHSSKLEAWLPAFVERRAPGIGAVDEGALLLHETASARVRRTTFRRPALAFADADAAVARRLAAALRTPAVELVPVSRVEGIARELAARHDAIVFLLSRFSQKALAELATFEGLVIVSYGPARVPDSLAHLQVLDMTNREVASIAEAVDETLETGRHGELATAADRRSSLLGLPRGVASFALGYLAMIGFLGFMLVNGTLEEREVAAIALPTALLSAAWLYLVLTRRAPLTLGLISTAGIVGIVAIAIGSQAPSTNNFLVLVVPVLWIYHQYSAMRTGTRDIDMWAPSRHLVSPWLHRRGHPAG